MPFVVAAGGLTLGIMLYMMREKRDAQAAVGEEYRSEGPVTRVGDNAIKQFTDNYPKSDNVGQFYDGLTPQGYDEWARRVNFNEPYYIVDEVARLVRESGNPKPQMLDVGAGTGLIGLKLHEKPEGRKVEIIGVDASE